MLKVKFHSLVKTLFKPTTSGLNGGSLFWYLVLCVLSSFAIILTRKRELIALVLLSFRCLVTVTVLCLFLMVPWVAADGYLKCDCGIIGSYSLTFLFAVL